MVGVGVGVGFYWGPDLYVGAFDALFLPRRTRILQSAAGILTDLVVCGAASLLALVGAGPPWAVILREFAVLGYLGAILNDFPLLELDGYWFLADTLDRPTLGRDSRAALRQFLEGALPTGASPPTAPRAWCSDSCCSALASVPGGRSSATSSAYCGTVASATRWLLDILSCLMSPW